LDLHRHRQRLDFRLPRRDRALALYRAGLTMRHFDKGPNRPNTYGGIRRYIPPISASFKRRPGKIAPPNDPFAIHRSAISNRKVKVTLPQFSWDKGVIE
jgi:hypothetical protein